MAIRRTASGRCSPWLTGEPAPQTVEEKRALALRHHFALWDSIGQCTITGSSDSSIRDVVPNDLRAITEHAPIERIFCNGNTSLKYYRRYNEPLLGRPAVVLPSTSRPTRRGHCSVWPRPGV